MPIPVLGELRDVSVGQAFRHEAMELTPWLLDNIERLGHALDLQLEPTGKEIRVDEFRADILARDIETEQPVLIENQLERSDTKHLGQILTYAAGLNAKTIVWVAPSFRDAHISAVRWLNENTRDDIAFFAVQLRVVQIGDSLPAPLFDVVARPDTWERIFKETAAAQQREMSLVGKFRLEFWTFHCGRHPEEGGARAAHHLVHPVEGTDIRVISYLANDAVGVFYRWPDRLTAEDFVQTYPAIAEGITERLHGDGRHQLRGKALFGNRIRIDMTERANWGSASDWLAAERKRFGYAAAQATAAAPPSTELGGES